MISLELAKLLKEKGYPQTSRISWYKHKFGATTLLDDRIPDINTKYWKKTYAAPDLIDVLDWLEKEYGCTRLYLQRFTNDYIQAELITALTNGVSFGGGKTRLEAIENAVLKVLEGKK